MLDAFIEAPTPSTPSNRCDARSRARKAVMAQLDGKEMA